VAMANGLHGSRVRKEGPLTEFCLGPQVGHDRLMSTGLTWCLVYTSESLVGLSFENLSIDLTTFDNPNRRCTKRQINSFGKV